MEVVAQASAAMAAMAAMADAAAAAAAPAADAAEAAEAAFAAPQQRARSEVWREARDPPTRDSTTDEPPPHTERPERAAAASGSSRATPCPLPDGIGGLIFALFTTGHFYLFFVFWWPAGNLRLPRFDAQGEAATPRRLKVFFKVTLVKMHAARRSERGGRRTSGPPHAVLSPPTSPRPFEHSETPPQALAVWSSGGRCEEVAGTAPLKPIWDEAEDHELMCAVKTYGTLWPSVAARLPGRTADAVRNRWHRLRQQQKFIDPSYERAKLGAPLLVMPSPSTAAEFAPSDAPTALATPVAADGAAAKFNLPLVAHAAPASTEYAVHGSGALATSSHPRACWTAYEDQMIDQGVRRFGYRWRQIAST